MKITEYRAYEILCWLDDQAGDHTNLFEQMTFYRDAAALIRQLRDAEQSAWHAGMDAGRELGRGKERAGAKAAEIEALRADVGEWKAIATWEKEQHDRLFKEARALNECAERLAEALWEMREYVTAALQDQREAFAGHEDSSDIPGIEADLHKIDTLLREQENDDA